MGKAGLGLEITELRLGILEMNKGKNKRVFSETIRDENSSNEDDDDDQKNQINYKSNVVIGWPPVRSYRKKNINNNRESGKSYVKVSMDGTPFLRKIELKTHRGYSDLGSTFEKLFGSSVIEEWSQYIAIYEDKDGDWMLVGDEPWQMFIDSCKKLRIMKKA